VYANLFVQEVPADLLFLSTSDELGVCHVETANLDGETNLKLKNCLKRTSHAHTADQLVDFEERWGRAAGLESSHGWKQAVTCFQSLRQGLHPPVTYLVAYDITRRVLQYRQGDAVLRPRRLAVHCEMPSPRLYVFDGALVDRLDPAAPHEPLTADNLLLRGCTIRKTVWVVGMLSPGCCSCFRLLTLHVGWSQLLSTGRVYTSCTVQIGLVVSAGIDTKIMMNRTSSPRKVNSRAVTAMADTMKLIPS
jgi:magnesium-transporting ATPase (P-type)